MHKHSGYRAAVKTASLCVIVCFCYLLAPPSKTEWSCSNLSTMTLVSKSAEVKRAGWRRRLCWDDSVCVLVWWGGCGCGAITQINCRPVLTPLRKEMWRVGMCVLWQQEKKGTRVASSHAFRLYMLTRLPAFCAYCATPAIPAPIVLGFGGSLLEGDSFWAETNTNLTINTVSPCQLIQ